MLGTEYWRCTDNSMTDMDDVRDWAAGVPNDILEMMVSHFYIDDDVESIDDLIRFSLTCKSWRSVTMNISIQSPKRFQQVPWLMSFTTKKNNGLCKFFNPIFNITHAMDIPELAGSFIHHSKHGWLLMSRGRTSFFFYNPFTKATIKLPDQQYLTLFGISFTAPPTSSDCMVFGHAESHTSFVKLYTCRPGDYSWACHRIDIDDDQQPFCSAVCSPVYCEGSFYWFGGNGKLGIFDIENSDFTIKECFFSDRQNYIAEYDGELFYTTVGSDGNPVGVFRLDRNGGDFKSVRLKSLGNKTMFVGDFGTLLIPAKGKSSANKIYFPRGVAGQKGGGGGGLYYCLRTGKYHSFKCIGSSSSQVDWKLTTVVNHCTWIEPNVS